jgi:hypothetical protein
MSNAVLSPAVSPSPPVLPGVQWAVAAVLAVWLAAVAALGAAGAFLTPAGAPPIPVAIGASVPLLAFFLAYRLAPAFRAWVLAIDLRTMAAIEAWRFGGLGFLALYANGVLPGAFALPAGIGDMAVAATAPLVLAALLRDPAFAKRGLFTAWNVLGMMDLVLAVFSGVRAAFLSTGAPGEITTGPMAHLPLVFIPVFLVPVFFMLHVAALLQARRLRMP